jgi:hypothetical protein
MSVLSNFYLDRMYFKKSLGFRHLWPIPVSPLQIENNRVFCVYTGPPYFPNGPTGCTAVSEHRTSLKVLASNIKSCGSECRNQKRAFYNLYSGFVMLMIIDGRQHHIIGNCYIKKQIKHEERKLCAYHLSDRHTPFVTNI